jgi:hypothetical protein
MSQISAAAFLVAYPGPFVNEKVISIKSNRHLYLRTPTGGSIVQPGARPTFGLPRGVLTVM